MIFEKKVVDMYRGMMYARCDDTGVAHYFSASDFKGLHDETYSFASSMGHALCGHIYYYDSPREGRLIVFEHGLGGGHRSYMREIELLCRHGFLVFSYDHTGCMESGGQGTNGLAQSLHDLDDCLNALSTDARFRAMDISVMGHSWGGFSTLNISALHPEVQSVVVLSGFVSVEKMVSSLFGGIMSGYRQPVMQLEQTSNPRFVHYDACTTLMQTNTRALLIYSDNDKLCRRAHYDDLHSQLGNCDNISFMLEHGKGHNPNYTAAAVNYLGEYSTRRTKETRAGRLSTEAQRARFRACFDWWRMTEQDDRVWRAIFDFLDK